MADSADTPPASHGATSAAVREDLDRQPLTVQTEPQVLHIDPEEGHEDQVGESLPRSFVAIPSVGADFQQGLSVSNKTPVAMV